MFQRCPSRVPLELAALRGLSAHGCFSCSWTIEGEQGPGEDGRHFQAAILPAGSRGRCLLGKRGGWSRRLGRASSPRRPLLFITHRRKTTSLQMQTREAEGRCAGCPQCPVFPAGRAWEHRAPPKTPSRLQQLLPGSFTVSSSYVSGVFVVCLFKRTLDVGPPQGREDGLYSSLLHAGGRTGQLIEEQIGVAGAHLAGGHGGDAAERAGTGQPGGRGPPRCSRAAGGVRGPVSDLSTGHPRPPSPVVSWTVFKWAAAQPSGPDLFCPGTDGGTGV